VPVARGETLDTSRTRAKLVGAATELFYRDGITASVDDIARRAGASKLTVYRHFGDKENLLEEVLRQRSDQVVKWLRAASEAPADPVERIVAVFEALDGWYREGRFRGCAIVNASAQASAAMSVPTRIAPRHLARLHRLFAELASEAGASDPARAARQLLILLEGATVVASVTGDLSAADDARALIRATLADADDTT
jgi:AcrR family transcriptional regulator